MSLATFADTGIASFVFAKTAEVGIIAEEFDISADVTDRDYGRAPDTLEAVLAGYGFNEVFPVTLSGIRLANGIMLETIGSAYTFATSVALCGHANANVQAVITSLSLNHPLGRFQRLNAGAEILGGISTLP